MINKKSIEVWPAEHESDQKNLEKGQMYIERFLTNGGQERLCRYCCKISGLDYDQVMKEENQKEVIDCQFTDYDQIASSDIF